MKRYRIFLLVVLGLPLVQLTFAQALETASALPRLVRFGGIVTEPNANRSQGWPALRLPSIPSKPAALRSGWRPRT